MPVSHAELQPGEQANTSYAMASLTLCVDQGAFVPTQKCPSMPDRLPHSTDEKNLSNDNVHYPRHDDFPSVNERRLLRKMDLRVIPVLSVLYVLAFLDR